MAEPCPPLEERLEARADQDRWDRLLLHAVDCLHCRDWLLMVGEQEALETDSGSRRRGKLAWGLSAAALLAVVGAGGMFVLGRRSSPDVPAYPYTLPAGERAVVPGEYAARPDRNLPLALPDDSRLRLEPGTRVLLLIPRDGDRARIQLVAGAVEADVVPGNGRFRIESEAGSVDVLGTHLRAKAFLMSGLPSLCVEVYHGKVRLRNSAGDLPVSGGERAVAVGNQRPGRQAIVGDWEPALASLARLSPLEDPEPARLLAGLILGSRWECPLDFEERPQDPVEIKRAKRLLRESSR